MKIGKYEFDSREAAQTKIDALGTATDEDGNEYPTHKTFFSTSRTYCS